MRFRWVGRTLWSFAFILWALLYLCVATAAGVVALYTIIKFPGDLHPWLLVGTWGLAAAAGAWILVALMKRAFGEEGAGRGEFNAAN